MVQSLGNRFKYFQKQENCLKKVQFNAQKNTLKKYSKNYFNYFVIVYIFILINYS